MPVFSKYGARGRDSNPHGLLHTPLKRARLPITPPQQYFQKIYLFAGAFAFAAGAAFVAALASAANEFVAGVSISALFESVGRRCSRSPARSAVPQPVFAGASVGRHPRCSEEPKHCRSVPASRSASADSINTIAAAIVIFESTDAVPRGPNAALETLLVNKAPASVLPGCSNTAPISTMHEIKNNAYKTYSKFVNRPTYL